MTPSATSPELPSLPARLGLQDGLRISLLNQPVILKQTGRGPEASELFARAEAIHTRLMRDREASA
ncbi:MAG TPA: hypothetical protein VG297_25080 [Bryobacteraceae bacterium]|nr:hypothetical protein [Bryobacteraceae bacterium]